VVQPIMNSDIMWLNISQKQESLSSIEADRPIAILVNSRTNNAGRYGRSIVHFRTRQTAESDLSDRYITSLVTKGTRQSQVAFFSRVDWRRTVRTAIPRVHTRHQQIASSLSPAVWEHLLPSLIQRHCQSRTKFIVFCWIR
jgi:hypothetical protein